jgi:hypothetical protein
MNSIETAAEPNGPRFPLRMREYATLSLEEARQVFGGQAELHRAWGLLYCDDEDGEHWTLLGSHSWVQSLRTRARPLSAEAIAAVPPSPSGARPAGLGVDMSPPVAAEWPPEEFGAEFVIRGWSDEWPALGRIEVVPYASVVPPKPFAKLATSDELRALNALAVEMDEVGASDEAMEQLDPEALHTGVCTAVDREHDRAWVVWFIRFRAGADTEFATVQIVSPLSRIAKLREVEVDDQVAESASELARSYQRTLLDRCEFEREAMAEIDRLTRDSD